MSISVYSKSGSVTGTYDLMLVGKTEYYNSKLSTNVQRFKVNVKCFTTVIKPKNSTLDYEIETETGLID
jgi:hypothetical protein